MDDLCAYGRSVLGVFWAVMSMLERWSFSTLVMRSVMGLKLVNELVQKLEGMSEQELTKYTKRCVCRKLNPEESDMGLDPTTELDLVHAEYVRRGLEKHYDMAFESVSKNPDACDAA